MTVSRDRWPCHVVTGPYYNTGPSIITCLLATNREENNFTSNSSLPLSIYKHASIMWTILPLNLPPPRCDQSVKYRTYNLATNHDSASWSRVVMTTSRDLSRGVCPYRKCKQLIFGVLLARSGSIVSIPRIASLHVAYFPSDRLSWHSGRFYRLFCCIIL